MRTKEEQENGYGRYCNHDLRRDLPRTSRDVAVLLSARYLTGPHVARDFTGAGEKMSGVPSSSTPQAASQKYALDEAGIS